MEKIELSTEDIRDAILLWVKTKHPELIEQAMIMDDSDVKWLWQIQLRPLAATITIFKDKEEFDTHKEAQEKEHKKILEGLCKGLIFSVLGVLAAIIYVLSQIRFNIND